MMMMMMMTMTMVTTMSSVDSRIEFFQYTIRRL